MHNQSQPLDFQIIESIRVLFSITKQLPPISSIYLLQVIQSEESTSQQNLADLLQMKPQSVSEHLKKMESAGLIVRTPSQKDRRVSMVSITDAGEKELEGAEDRMKAYTDAFLSGFSLEEKTVLDGLLKKMISANENKENKLTPAVHHKNKQQPHPPRVPDASLGLDMANHMICTCKGRRCIVSWDEKGNIEGHSCRIGLESAAEIMQRNQ